MSMTFYIKNKKRLFFGYFLPLTVERALSFAPNLAQFNFDEYADGFDKESFYQSFLDEHEYLLIGVAGQSGRGFELAYDKEQKRYSIRVMTPSTRLDWQLAIAYLKILALRFGSDIVDENGEVYTHETISKFDFKADIMAGLAVINNHLNDDFETNFIFGIIRPLAINRKMIDAILNDANPVESFNYAITSVQNVDAYSAKQQFYKNGSEILGVYTLTQELTTILPFKPFVEWQNTESIKNNDVTHWKILLVGIKGDANNADNYYTIGELSYELFISRLPEEKYKFIDASYIVVEALSEDELKALLKD